MQLLTGVIQDLYYFDLKLVVLPHIIPSNHEHICQALIWGSKKKLQRALLLSNFITKCNTGYISTSLATLGSIWVSKEAEFIKKFNFLQGWWKPLNIGCADTNKHPIFWIQIWIFTQKRDKYWVCSCTPCTPASTGPGNMRCLICKLST